MSLNASPPSQIKEEIGRSPGPHSIMWDTFSDLTFFPFSIPVLIMQAAHPDIGAAVAKYSIYQHEPWGRLFRTIFSLLRFIHGGKNGDLGRREAEELRALHAHIKGEHADGSRYHALRPQAYRVVPDTFLVAVLQFRETMGEDLTAEQKDTLFAEYINLCLLFGIPRSELEDTLDAFLGYFDKLLLQTMTHNEIVAFLLGDMMMYGPAMRYFPLPERWRRSIYHRLVYPWVRLFTLGFLDPRFKEKHGIEWDKKDQRRYQFWVKVVRIFRKVVPRFLRYSPFALYVMWGGRGMKIVSYEHLKKYLHK